MNFKKTTWLLALCVLAGGAAFAQTPTATAAADSSTHHETQTLFGKMRHKLTHFGFAIAPEYQYLGAAGGYGNGGGATGMLVLNRRWSVGLSAFGADEIAPKDNQTLSLRYNAMGGILEFTPRPYRLVHLSFPLFLGGGMAGLYSNTVYDTHNDHIYTRGHGGGDVFFVAQPNIRAEMNLTRFARIYVGTGYRLAVGNNTVAYTDSIGTSLSLGTNDLSGLSVQAGLKLGLFGFPIKRN